MSFKKILVAVDYSDCSRVALEYAAELASRFGAELDVVHAWDRPHYTRDDEIIITHSGDEKKTLGDVLRETAEEDMKVFFASCTVPSGVKVTHHVEHGHVVTALIELTKKGAHDLIVTGTHGRTGFRRWVLGSVAERLLRLSPVPVLTVPPTDTDGK